jgi:thiol-disulfide isomerase/thioredoxin
MSFLTAQQVQLGPVTLQTDTFLVLVAALVGIALVALRFRAERDRRRLFFNHLGTAALLVLLGWKVFPLFYSFGEMIRHPLTLLYTPGGTPGLLLGLLLGALYVGVVILRGRRRRTPARRLLSPSLVFAAGFIPVSGLLLGSASALRAERVAEPAAPFAATTVQGQEVRLDDLRGKTVILNFWATWCPPCRAELPTLIAFNEELRGRDVKLVGIAVGPSQTPGAVKPFMQQAGVDYPVILDADRGIAARYGVRTLPTTVVISPGGTITDRRVGAVDRYWLRSHGAAGR